MLLGCSDKARDMKLYLALMTDHRPLSITVLLALLACCLNLSLTSCSKPAPVAAPENAAQSPAPAAGQSSAPTASQAPTPANALDACSLLMTKEIEQIQGAPLKDTK